MVQYEKGQKWTGDQGLLIGGLMALWDESEAIKSSNSHLDRTAIDLGRALADRAWGLVENAMSQLFEADKKILHEATLSGDFLDKYLADYSTGKGVFMRYLAYAGQTMDLSGYSDHIIGTAEGALRYGCRSVEKDKKGKKKGLSLSWSPNGDTPFGTNDTDPALALDPASPSDQVVLQASRLNALNAAIPLIPK
jgi:hypothetical protein